MDGNLVRMVLMDDDDDDDAIAAVLHEFGNDNDNGEDARERVFVDQEGWRALSNSSFKANFRMDRTVFQRLVVVFGNHLYGRGMAENVGLRNRTLLDMRLLMGLWPIFNPDTYRSAASHFGTSKSVIHFHYLIVIKTLRELASKYIKWPSDLERDTIRVSFEEKYGYPGVVGCIDGVLFKVTAPLEQPARYQQRDRHYSIVCQAVCDHRLLYRDIYVGEPGSIGDARNFDRSPLSNNLLARPDMVHDNEHILGDGAYTLSSKIIIPYINDGHLTRRQRTHNYVLSKCRAAIERSFALLKGRHRRLKMLPMRNMNYTIDHIAASFVLHNFIILDGYEAEGLPARAMDLMPRDQLDLLNNAARQSGALKREYIANLLQRDG